MKKIFLFLAICISLTGCKKEDDANPDKTDYNLRITFSEDSQLSPEVSIYAIEGEHIPISHCKIHDGSRSGVTKLNVGNYFIYYEINNYTCGFQIREDQITNIKIVKGTPIVTFENYE